MLLSPGCNCCGGAPSGTKTYAVTGCNGVAAVGATITVIQSGVTIDTQTTDGTGHATVHYPTTGPSYTMTVAMSRYATRTFTLAAGGVAVNPILLSAGTGYVCCSMCDYPLPTTMYVTNAYGTWPIVTGPGCVWNSGCISFSRPCIVDCSTIPPTSGTASCAMTYAYDGNLTVTWSGSSNGVTETGDCAGHGSYPASCGAPNPCSQTLPSASITCSPLLASFTVPTAAGGCDGCPATGTTTVSE